MRKAKFGKLLTVSLPLDLYDLVKKISDQRQISMGEVIRDSIEYSMKYDGDWMAAKESKPNKIDFTEIEKGGNK